MVVRTVILPDVGDRIHWVIYGVFACHIGIQMQYQYVIREKKRIAAHATTPPFGGLQAPFVYTLPAAAERTSRRRP